MKLLRILLILSLFWLSCQNGINNYNSEYANYMDNFHGITSTDEFGNILGNIDSDDWNCGNSISLLKNYEFYTLDSVDTDSIITITDSTITITDSTSIIVVPITELIVIGNQNEIVISEIIIAGFNSIFINSAVSVITINDNTPAEFLVSPAFPNPTNGSTNIIVSILDIGNYNLFILDENANNIKNVYSGLLENGTHMINWDLTNNELQLIESGLYRVVLLSDNEYCYGDIQVIF